MMRRKPHTSAQTPQPAPRCEKTVEMPVGGVQPVVGVDPGKPGADKTAYHGVLIAKKDFVIRQEPYLRVIKVGDDLSDVPEKYHVNLRTEGVL